MTLSDSPAYQEKKRFFQRILTIYGRNPVLEALQDPNIAAYKLHLADSNRRSSAIDQLESLARNRGAEIAYHSREALARISKNGKQDQGVALDVRCERLATIEELLEAPPERFELLALDGVTNPQNLGMIIRSVCASPLLGLLLPERGCAKLDALVIKASAGTLFRARIYRCQDLPASLRALKDAGAAIYGLAAQSQKAIGSLVATPRCVFVLGNESQGLSAPVADECSDHLRIPMCNGVESLNVSVAASLIAFRSVLFKTPTE